MDQHSLTKCSEARAYPHLSAFGLAQYSSATVSHQIANPSLTSWLHCWDTIPGSICVTSPFFSSKCWIERTVLRTPSTCPRSQPCLAPCSAARPIGRLVSRLRRRYGGWIQQLGWDETPPHAGFVTTYPLVRNLVHPQSGWGILSPNSSVTCSGTSLQGSHCHLITQLLGASAR